MPNRSNIAPALVVLVGASALVGMLAPHGAGAAQSAAVLERGRYIVQNIGNCADCHGPGLHGSTLAFLAPGLPPAVARKAPRIAGLPRLSAPQAVHFFETGLLPDGTQARPPMPALRLHHEDAEAVAAYLKSVK